MTNEPSNHTESNNNNTISKNNPETENTAGSNIILEEMKGDEHGSHHSSHSHHSHKHRKKRSSKEKYSVVTASGKIVYRKRPPRRSQRHRRKVIRRTIIGVLLAILIVVGGSAFALKYMTNQGKKALLADNATAKIDTSTAVDDANTSENGQTIIYHDETYHFNKDLISIVILGVDKPELDSTEYGNAGQTDAIYIFTYDTKSKKCSLVPVSRETMTDVRLYSTSGQEMGLKNMQICLAYAYGDGKESSCTNTLESLSRVFYNIPFSTYVSMNWDIIAPMNDAIDGVRLTALEDIKTEYSDIKKDERITLMGKDAWSYVKYRNTTKLESNQDRLKRQQQYIDAYVSKLIPIVRDDISMIPSLYDTASEYMYTNVNRNKMLYIASEIAPELYSSKEINFVTIDGEIKQGEQYAEFYPDETSLFETILKVFYVKEVK